MFVVDYSVVFREMLCLVNGISGDSGVLYGYHRPHESPKQRRPPATGADAIAKRR